VTVTTELALATLGFATKNGNDPICVTPPKVAKASTVTCPWCYHPTDVANVNEPLIKSNGVLSET